MQARKLKKLLNNTGYRIGDYDDYIAVGSPMCHKLISVDKKTLNVKYALDSFRQGRAALGSSELEFIWDKLHELKESGEITEIINGVDHIENPITIYTVVDGTLIEKTTDRFLDLSADSYDYSTTHDGEIFVDGYYLTKEEAIKYGILNLTRRIFHIKESVSCKRKELQEAEERLNTNVNYLMGLEKMLSLK